METFSSSFARPIGPRDRPAYNILSRVAHSEGLRGVAHPPLTPKAYLARLTWLAVNDIDK